MLLQGYNVDSNVWLCTILCMDKTLAANNINICIIRMKTKISLNMFINVSPF